MLDYLEILDEDSEVCYITLSDIIINECYIDDCDDFVFMPMSSFNYSGRINEFSSFDISYNFISYNSDSSKLDEA